MKKSLWIVLLVTLLIGCGNKPGTSSSTNQQPGSQAGNQPGPDDSGFRTAGACNHLTRKFCTEFALSSNYTGTTVTAASDVIKKTCERDADHVFVSACPTANAMGGCRRLQGPSTRMSTIYYVGNGQADSTDSVKLICAKKDSDFFTPLK